MGRILSCHLKFLKIELEWSDPPQQAIHPLSLLAGPSPQFILPLNQHRKVVSSMSQAVLCDNYSLNEKSIYYNGETSHFYPKRDAVLQDYKKVHIKANKGTTSEAIYL